MKVLFRCMHYYNDRQDMALSSFFFLYFISTFEMLPYEINTSIIMRDISKVLAKLILNFDGTEIVKPVDVSI